MASPEKPVLLNAPGDSRAGCNRRVWGSLLLQEKQTEREHFRPGRAQLQLGCCSNQAMRSISSHLQAAQGSLLTRGRQGSGRHISPGPELARQSSSASCRGRSSWPGKLPGNTKWTAVLPWMTSEVLGAHQTVTQSWKVCLVPEVRES